MRICYKNSLDLSVLVRSQQDSLWNIHNLLNPTCFYRKQMRKLYISLDVNVGLSGVKLNSSPH